MQNPLRKLGREVPEPPKSGEVLKPQKPEKPTALRQVLDDVFSDKSEVNRQDIDDPVIPVMPFEDMSMEMDVPAEPKQKGLLRRLWGWLNRNNSPKHLICVQKMAQAERKLSAMNYEASRQIDRGQNDQLKKAYAAYENLAKYLKKEFQGRNLNLNDVMVWDEFLAILDDNSKYRGLDKFPAFQEIDMLLDKYHKDSLVIRLLLVKVSRKGVAELGVFVRSDYLTRLPEKPRHILMSQLTVRSAATIAKALAIFEKLPANYTTSHFRNFGIIQFAESSRAEEVTEEIVQAAMLAGINNEERIRQS